MAKGKVDALLGIVFGDEGKGKVVDVFTPRYDIVARFAGGPNAGHTILFEGKKFVLRSIPSGIFDENKLNIIGGGCVIAPDLFMAEACELEAAGYDVTAGREESRKLILQVPLARASAPLTVRKPLVRDCVWEIYWTTSVLNMRR